MLASHDRYTYPFYTPYGQMEHKLCIIGKWMRKNRGLSAALGLHVDSILIWADESTSPEWPIHEMQSTFLTALYSHKFLKKQQSSTSYCDVSTCCEKLVAWQQVNALSKLLTEGLWHVYGFRWLGLLAATPLEGVQHCGQMGAWRLHWHVLMSYSCQEL